MASVIYLYFSLQEGANMVKWTKKVLLYTKIIIFWVKGLKVAPSVIKIGFIFYF